MENEVQAVEPAGHDGNTPLEMTLDDAVALSASRVAEQASPASAETPQPAAADAAEAAEATPASAEPDPFDWERVPGTAKFRLRDGTIVSAAEIKKNWDDFQQLPKTRQELEADRHRVHQATVQSAQYAQYLNNTLPVVVHYAQSMMPQPPKQPEYIEGDFVGNQQKQIAYERDRDLYQQKAWELQQLQHALRNQQQKQSQEQREAWDAHVRSEDAKLREARPYLSNAAKQEQFMKDLHAVAASVGFQPEDLRRFASDHRLILLSELAIEAFKLRTNPPRPAQPKPAAASPVAQPGRRVDGAEASRQARSEVLQRARKQGGFDSIEDAIAAFGSSRR